LTSLSHDRAAALLVTGASGRIGRALRVLLPANRAGALPILWQGRRAEPWADLNWDMAADPQVRLPGGLIILHLAGRTTGSPQDLDENRVLTETVCRAANASGAVHVFVMSSAAVYAPGPAPLSERAEPAPINAYGLSKLAAERAAVASVRGPGLTLLRLANLAGADALLGNLRDGVPSILDPVAGQPGGPERSYIGPRDLTEVLLALVARAAATRPLPRILNLAQPGVIAMADLLTAAGQPWSFGPPRAGVVGRVVLDTGLLESLVAVPAATPAGLVAEVASVPGWPR
jgi:nucleoside-diphosphate-sugar epimerase